MDKIEIFDHIFITSVGKLYFVVGLWILAKKTVSNKMVSRVKIM